MEHFKCRSVSQLQDRALHDPEIFGQLLQFLTVQVSEMFRDPGYFKALREEVVPVLKTYPSVRLWVAGCSTGEEVWSLLIVLAEEGLLELSRVYATDINTTSLHMAEAGVYPVDRIAQWSSNYLAAGGKRSLSDYYHAAYGAAVFDRALRQKVLSPITVWRPITYSPRCISSRVGTC